jgi:hypothetical protein
MIHQPYLIYDLECTSKPESELESLMPEFQASGVLKDPAKILADIAAKKQKWLDDAALSAITGTLLCIGISESGNSGVIHGTEEAILREFWDHCSSMKEESAGACIFVGYNSHSFDLPWLIRKSWLLGVPVPSWIRRGRYFSDLWTDLREVWQCGDRQESTGGLSGLARAFGLGDKLGSGKHFGKLWAEDREAAIAYVMKDIQITEQLALRMGVIQPRSNDAIIIEQSESDDFDY